MLREEKGNFTVFNTRKNGGVWIMDSGRHDFSVLKSNYTMYVQPHHTLHCVSRGNGILVLNDRKYTVGHGEIFFAPAGSRLVYYADAENPWEYLFFTFCGADCAGYLEAAGLSASDPVLKPKKSTEIQNAITRCHERIRQGVSDSGLCLVGAFFEVLVLIGEEKSPRAEAPPEDYRKMLALRVKDFLDKNFADPDFKVSDLCYKTTYSHSYLYAVFREYFGVSLESYLLRAKLEYAAALLGQRNLSVRETALRSGFYDPVHFSKSFSAKYGASPTKYRKASHKSTDE